MENIKISQICGLCQGCKNAITLALDSSIKQKTTIYKEIVHNKNINDSLKSKGILCEEDLNQIDKNSIVVIRAHGEPPETYKLLDKLNLKFLDGTCKNVKAIHNLVEQYSNNDFKIIIIGKYGKLNNHIHPEVFGVIGYCKTEPILIEDVDDLDKLKTIKNSNLLVVSQTTFNPNKFDILINTIKELSSKNNNYLVIKNTICGAQLAIQKASLNLANESDLMIIVGGKHSSNTIELFNNISKERKAIHIENINDWKLEIDKIKFPLTKNTKIGLTAGASTDKSELKNLKKLIEDYFLEN